MFWTVTLSLLKGLGAATQLFFLTLLFALPLGLIIAFGSMNKWQPFRFLLYGQEHPSNSTCRSAGWRAGGLSAGSPTWWSGSSGARR